MRILYLPYTVLFSLFFVVLVPAFWVYSRITGRYTGNFNERLGCIPDHVLSRLSGRPRIWIHAVSLGEVKVAAAIINDLKRIRPECSMIVSTTTESGRDMAHETFGTEIPVIYAPIDFVGSVRNALLRISPDVMVFLETELWPTWVRQAHRMGIRTALINGRISSRSVHGYLRLRFFFREVLKN